MTVTRNLDPIQPADWAGACEKLPISAILCSGIDAGAFLHGQLSNDIEGLADGSAGFNAYCNPRGRVIATMHVLKLANERFLILMEQDLVESVLSRLRMFVLRAKLVFQPLEGGTVSGCTDITALSHLVPSPDLRPSPGSIIEFGDGSYIYNPGHGENRFMVIQCRAADGIGRPEKQAAADRSTWFSAQIAAGIPMVSQATSELFLPQAINLDLTGGISFRKGCYPGQEIVARLRYLGKLKQRMLPYTCESQKIPCAGEPLYSDGKKIGHSVMAAKVPDGDSGLGLASVAFADLDRKDVQSENGARLKIMLPPYAIPELEPDFGS